MIELYRKIFKELLFNSSNEKNLVFTVEHLEEKGSRDTQLSTKIFPESIVHHKLSGGVRYLHELKEIIRVEDPDNLFFFPPLISRHQMSADLKKKHPGFDFSSLVFLEAIKSIKSGCKCGVLLPETFSKTKMLESARKTIFSQAKLDYYIENDFPVSELGLSAISMINLNTLFLKKGADQSTPTRFFKVSNQAYNATEQEIIKDLKILKKQGGGSTHYGFVVREPIKPGTKLGYDILNPKLHTRLNDLQDVGEVKLLGDLFEIKRGPHVSRNQRVSNKDSKNHSIGVLNTKALQENGDINEDEIRQWVNDVSEDLIFRKNDLCVLAVQRNFEFTHIEDEPSKKYVPSQHLILLRPIDKISNDVVKIIAKYLRSDLALKWIQANSGGLVISVSTLKKLPVPIIDKNFRVAINDMIDARVEFQQWAELGENSINSLFEIDYSQNRKFELLKSGRLLRQKLAAIREVDKLSYRISNLFPHPIAYRWRKIEASKPDREGIENVLDCFEVLIVYLSIIAVVSSRKTDNVAIQRVNEIAKQLSSTRKAGISLGDWIGLVKECNEKDVENLSDEWIPFQEVFGFLKDNITIKAVDLLHTRRNDYAHGRGPSNQKEVEEFFHLAKKDLDVVLSHVEFISEYKLLFIESTKWDSVEEKNYYDYRKLMGDHPLVPVESGVSGNNQIEKGSLYIKDRNGELHLLRPFFTRRNCIKCGRSAIFYLDTYDNKTEVCSLKSLEEGHIIEDSRVSKIYKKVGMLN